MPNLLDILDHDPPMGDLFSFRSLSQVRSTWTTPLPEEPDAPDRRIIHTRAFRPPGRARMDRLGIQPGRAYHKCGSHSDQDWVEDIRVLSIDQPSGSWQPISYLRNLGTQADSEILWIDLEHRETYGLLIEIRRCGIDGWWTPWNLAWDAFVLEGELLDPIAPRHEEALRVDSIDLQSLPNGLTASTVDGTVHYKSAFLEVGFYLGRPGFAYFNLDAEGQHRSQGNCLKTGPGAFHQGTLLSETGAPPLADRAVRFAFQGTTCVKGNTIVYDIHDPETGLTYQIFWKIHPRELELTVSRFCPRDFRAWRSAAWEITVDPSASIGHALGLLMREGQTGMLQPPFILHFPKQGSLKVQVEGNGHLRSEVYRPNKRIDWEFKVSEQTTPEGDWLLPAGPAEARFRFCVFEPDLALKPDTPEAVRSVLKKTIHTALTFRADTGTLSNNGASIHCPISMDTWASQTVRLGELLPGLPANHFLQMSLERWLDGGPGYASGNLVSNAIHHPAENEYLMTGSAALMGLADFLKAGSPEGWIARYETQIRQKLEALKSRDLDGDGLIESEQRTGIRGSGQWSTVWLDVISFGWKDAWTNAILYEALKAFLVSFPNTPLEDWCPRIEVWARTLKANYFPTFFDEAVGWFAGWRCRENQLHNFAFLPPNGAAVAAALVAPALGQEILGRLLEEMKRVRMPSAELGLPCNLWPIPDSDRADILQGYPFGYYQNGGRTHAQAYHFLRGLYAVGLSSAADPLLEGLSRGMARGDTIGPLNSGVDWRYWDDRPCGYEGLLTDQFGFLAVALERWQA